MMRPVILSRPANTAVELTIFAAGGPETTSSAGGAVGAAEAGCEPLPGCDSPDPPGGAPAGAAALGAGAAVGAVATGVAAPGGGGKGWDSIAPGDGASGDGRAKAAPGGGSAARAGGV